MSSVAHRCVLPEKEFANYVKSVLCFSWREILLVIKDDVIGVR
jgi:hypothetical protein